MDIVISRILKYLNGCLEDNYLYRIGIFVVKHYVDMENYTLNKMSEDGSFTQDEIIDFCKHLGFDTFEDFQQQLFSDYMLRVSQIRARMLGVSSEFLLEQLDVDYQMDDLLKELEGICGLVFKKKRVILIGALYPMSISVDFQTDFITFGKEVIQYHHFVDDFQFTENDIVIFISATGRMMNAYLKDNEHKNISEAQVILMTQNKKYNKDNKLGAHYVIQIPGRFDGIQFNYQIMLLFDILRIYYYQKFYI